MNFAILKLNFKVSILSLESYYDQLIKNYSHLKWSWDKHSHEITEEWYNRILNNGIGCTYPYGWSIQSNLIDKTIPCPPYNISIHERGKYENTELVFGIVKELIELLPYTYRWSLIVQPPNGKVSRHVDPGNEYTAHIPIYSSENSFFKFWDEKDNRKDFSLKADGSIYIVNTRMQHETENYGNTDRIGLVFRFNQEDLPRLLKIKGLIE